MLLKVVIADDEARVCNLVKMLADWDALGMEVVGTASNGFEALKFVEQIKPDILITDIRMPGCDGLELIRQAKLLVPNLEIAIISGYAQFEYAQTAVSYNAGAYLLKPIKKDVLIATLEKLGGKCRERAASKSALEHLRQNSDTNRELLRSRLPEDLLNGRLQAPTRELLRRDYGFKLHDGLFQVFILKMDYDRETFSASSIAVARAKAEEFIDSMLFSLCISGVFQFYKSAGYGVIHYASTDSDPVRRALRQCLNQLETQKFIFGPVEFSLSVGKAVKSPEDLPLSMREAQNAVTERIVEGTGRLLESAPRRSLLNEGKLLDQYNRALNHVADTLDAEDADKAADDLQKEVGGIPGLHGYELLGLVLAAGKMFTIRFNIKDEPGLTHEFESRCELCASADKLFDCLRVFQRQWIGVVRERRESEKSRPIRIAKQYIHQHFNEPITLEDVSAATGFSVNYFSAMFKKETGEGFSKYLTHVRMERAKDLLRDTNYSVAEICRRVGYSDLKHFTGAFKKTTGLNPGQYRKLC
ncbi:MAG: helix-turn-helix domain-containing protein [Oscillospiraceae bacterium]|nr:helix-turn-helix domain-containing protein [Oscillospiraceae bacterium]